MKTKCCSLEVTDLLEKDTCEELLLNNHQVSPPHFH